MSLFLKSVWRGILRPLALSPLTSRSLAYNVTLPEIHTRSPDAIMSQLKSSQSTSAVLATVEAHLPVMTHRHMLHALRCIFDLQKTDNDNSGNLIKDPTFGILCQNFKRHARALDANEAIEATKVLSFLGVPVESLIIQTMLQLIRTQINILNVRQIMFLDFILSRFDTKNHLVDALKLALPLAFQIHLPLEMDSQDFPLLKDMLNYCCKHDLPDRCINNVVTGLLLHDQTIDAQGAKQIIWSLCQINCTDSLFPTRAQLLHICFDILTQNVDKLTYDEVLRTAAKVKGRILEKHPEYYHEQLMDAFANYIVQREIDFERGLLVARVLSRIAHTHLGLIEYLCQLATMNPSMLSNARTNILFGFVNCLSNNNYIPSNEHWNTIKQQISSNAVLDGKNSALPWAKFCLELASLGQYEDKLLERVFSKEFLKGYLLREHNTLDYLQLLTLHEAVNTFYSDNYKLPSEILMKAREVYPVHSMTEQLEESLAKGLGSRDFIVKNVALPNGIVSDLLMYLKNGYPVELHRPHNEKKIPIEMLQLPKGGFVVCLMNFNQGCFSLNSNRLRGTFRLLLDILEKQGFAAVAVNVSEWLAAPSHERTPYLMREIGYKCGEIGMKLSIT